MQTIDLPTLHTNRLTLRPFATEDVTALFNICKDEHAMRFMPALPHASVEDTQTWLNEELSREGAQFWTVTLNDTGQPLGHVNFLGGTRFPGMGYMLHPDYWGQGYAPEACRAALAYGFEHLGYDRMGLWIDETNVA
ncbi:MAG: GNAT family N-acetyltransferase [Okeania sp. SIO3B3]|nr:GNAT family N-acetyltransferase [Okeania sp. SIO3B3]